jgi:undecaprenyl-diphosphatase
MARDFTALGGVAVLLMITLAVVGYLILADKQRIAVFVFAAVCGGLVLSSLFKTAFDRPRPDLVPHLSYVYSASFPSGHSMMSAITYLTLGALLARIHKGRALKIYFLGLAMLLTFAIGLSRIYLGVHWPTDVIAGWAAGASWAILCWLVALWLQQRRVVEPEANGIAVAETKGS